MRYQTEEFSRLGMFLSPEGSILLELVSLINSRSSILSEMIPRHLNITSKRVGMVCEIAQLLNQISATKNETKMRRPFSLDTTGSLLTRTNSEDTN